MIEYLQAIANIVLLTVAICSWLYAIPFFIRKGWGDARNKTMKVCDQCFRDIDMVNKLVKKIEEESRKLEPTQAQ